MGLGISNTLRPGLAGWAKSLSREVAADGVTVNLLLPGAFATDRAQEVEQARAAQTGESVEVIRAATVAGIPLGRRGEVAEFAAAAAFLASARAGYITGAAVPVDGGLIGCL